QLALFTGGLMVIPSCDFSKENILAAYEKLQITEDHKKLLTKVVATILPGGEIRGAEELNVQDFVLVMANDCLNEENQSDFTNGLKHFDKYVQKKYGNSFGKMEQHKAEEVFNTIVNDEEITPDSPKKDGYNLNEIKNFLGTTKKFTLQGYLSTEYFMTEVMPYKMIPGGFKGEKLIDPSEKINING